MKKQIFLALSVVAVAGVITACVSTVDGGKTGGVPFVRDSLEGRYERTPEQVFTAAREVVLFNGALVSDGTLYSQTNRARIIEGKINQRDVYIRVEPVDPKVTSVIVQVRTSGGASDLPLAHTVEKEIALKLVGTR